MPTGSDGVDSKYKPKGYGSGSVDETDEFGDDYYLEDGDLEAPGEAGEGYDTGYQSGKAGNAGQGYSAKGYGSGGVSSSGSFESPASPQELNFLSQLVQKFPFEVAAEKFFQKYGYYPTKADYNFAKSGYSGKQGPVPYYHNTSHGSQVSQYMKGYGAPGNNQDMMKFFQDQQMTQDAKDQARGSKKQAEEDKRRVHMIMLLLMMGEIDQAVRAFTVLTQKQAMAFARIIVKKLGLVSKARAMVIRNFAKAKPPRAYAGKNPDTAARAQDKSARYNQFVQLNVQLMGELQNSQKELMDALVTINREVDTMWQMNSEIGERSARTKEKLVSR